MGLVLLMISVGTSMSALDWNLSAPDYKVSESKVSLDHLKSNDKGVLRTFERNNVNYDILEQPGKMSMYFAKGVFTVSYVNNAKSKLAFRLVDSSGDLVYSDNSSKVMYHQRMKTQKLPKGMYTAIMVAEDDYFEKRFEIK